MMEVFIVWGEHDSEIGQFPLYVASTKEKAQAFLNEHCPRYWYSSLYMARTLVDKEHGGEMCYETIDQDALPEIE